MTPTTLQRRVPPRVAPLPGARAPLAAARAPLAAPVPPAAPLRLTEDSAPLHDRVLACLAPALTRHYPGGLDWLGRRLGDVRAGAARCAVALAGGMVAGVAIETPKPAGALKLSTLWVHPLLRRSGIASRLLDWRAGQWDLAGVRRTHITLPVTMRADFDALLLAHGFVHVATEAHRYGRDRHEAVYVRWP